MQLVVGIVFLSVAGYIAADLRGRYVAAPVITSVMSYKNVTGIIAKIERYDRRKRIVLEQVEIERLDDKETPKKIRVSFPDSHLVSGLAIGTRISTQATLRPPPLPSVYGLYDFARVAWFQQIGAIGYSTKPINVSNNYSGNNHTFYERVKRKFEQFRDDVTSNLRSESSDIDGPILAGLRAALVTGDRTGINEETYGMICNAGLAHLLAISGLHMGFIAMLVYTSVQFILALIPTISLNYNSKKIAAIAAILVAAFYMFLSGQTVPTERAFIMTVIVLSGVLFDRNVISLRTVSIAACVILVLHPETLLSASFQLSFAAVTCLVAAYESQHLKSLMIYSQQSFISRVVGYVLILALTSLIATAATAPFSIYHFGQMASYGLIANLIAVPIMGIIVMPAAIISMLLMPFGLESIGFWFMDHGLSFILFVAKWVSSLDGSVILYGGINKLSIMLIALSMLWLCLWQGYLRYFSFIFLIAIYSFPHNRIEKQIFIDGEGQMVGFYDQDLGAFINVSRGKKFVKKLWMTSWGVEAFQPFNDFEYRNYDQKIAQEETICGKEGCQFNFGLVSIFNVYSQEAAYEACDYAGLVIFPCGYINRSRCANSTVIDRKTLFERGGLTLTKYSGSPELKIISVIEKNEDKPWYRARKK